MYRRSFALFFTIHSVRAVPFEISKKDAQDEIHTKYESHWFGPSTEYIHFQNTTAEYLPFFLCRGEMRGTYTAQIKYDDRVTDWNGKTHTSTRYVDTAPQPFVSSFQENKAQIYAGYKFSNRQVSKVIVDAEAPLLSKKIHEVDTSVANINLFEMSTTTLSATAKAFALKMADLEATRFVEGFHQGHKGITINWSEFEVVLDEVYPTYLPAFISKVEYDSEIFTIYSNGRTGNSTGPYLLSGVALGRMAALATVGITTLLMPSKPLGLLYGSIASIPLYYAAFYFAKRWPVYVRDRNRRERAARQLSQSEADREGYRPDLESQRRIFEEKQKSQQKNARYEQKKIQTGRVRDVEGHYRRLKVPTDASVNEIRQAYRQLAIQNHPDAGGDSETMKKLNEAYRVLRDPKTREEYDRMFSKGG